MYKLKEKNGLLYADVDISIRDKTVHIDDVIIDTGSFHTIIMTDYLKTLEVDFEDDDELVYSSGLGGAVMASVRKKVDKLSIGGIVLSNTKIDFGVIDPLDRINGLLGLDFLRNVGILIDLDELIILKKQNS